MSVCLSLGYQRMLDQIRPSQLPFGTPLALTTNSPPHQLFKLVHWEDTIPSYILASGPLAFKLEGLLVLSINAFLNMIFQRDQGKSKGNLSAVKKVWFFPTTMNCILAKEDVSGVVVNCVPPRQKDLIDECIALIVTKTTHHRHLCNR